MCEQMIADQCAATGLAAVGLRYFNAAGADPDGELGEEHDPETHLILLVLAAAAGRLSHVTVFGDDYPTPDGTCIRDYVHVTDLAAGHVAALEALDTSGGWRAFNLGTSRGTSVREIIAAVERITGKPVPVEVGPRRVPRRAGDPSVLVADASEAAAALSWQPVHSNIDDIVQTAWAWLLGRGETLPAPTGSGSGTASVE